MRLRLFCLIVLFFSTAVDILDLVVFVIVCCWIRMKSVCFESEVEEDE